MKFDFDKVIQRKGTNSLKYDIAEIGRASCRERV